MREISGVKKVGLTYDELMKVHCVLQNRLGYLSKKEALENGFSEADWDKFLSRAKKLKKTILAKGFSKTSCFVLAKNENGDLYILDGQGRRMALKLIHEEEHKILDDVFVCDLYTEPMTEQEMSKYIIDMNTGNTNWRTQDIRRCDAMSSDDEEVKKAYAYTKKLMDDLEIGDYNACLFTYGEKASHQKIESLTLSTRNYAVTREIFTEAYKKFIVNLSYKKDKNGNDIERPQNVKKSIRNVAFAISFNSCLRSIVRAHNNDVNEAKDDIMHFVDVLLKAANGDDAYVKQFVKCSKKDKEVVANKVKSYLSRGCRKTIIEALYKTAA